MTFNSPIFLFAFLPIVLAGYFLLSPKYRNVFLVITSLVFYFWSGPTLFPVILIFIFFNYIFGILIDKTQKQIKISKAILALGIIINLSLLFLFKDYAIYWVEKFYQYTGLETNQILIEQLNKLSTLPLGISFISFASVAYLIEIHQQVTTSEKNIIDFSLFISFFPKLIAGPITRYSDLKNEIKSRDETLQHIGDGIRRFIWGLAKKVLIADVLGPIVDQIFSLNEQQLTPQLAWTAIIFFTLQIYFDFSGYSDMAIGLGNIFGLKIVENFNFPYISKSIGEFWRRWHITLSDWFRDFLYLPLEEKRIKKNGSQWLWGSINVLIVFLLSGFWHGAQLQFIAWGGSQGVAIAFEKTKPGKWLKNRHPIIRHIYALTIIIVGWVFFRARDMKYGTMYLSTMLGFNHGGAIISFAQMPPIDHYVWIIMTIGVLLSTPILRIFRNYENTLWLPIIRDILLLVLFLLSITYIVSATYNTFIYAQF